MQILRRVYTHIYEHMCIYTLYIYTNNTGKMHIYIYMYTDINLDVYIYTYTLLSCVLAGSPSAGLKMPSPLVSLLWSSRFSAEKVSEKEKKYIKYILNV